MNIVAPQPPLARDLPPLIERFITLYKTLDKTNLERINEIYSPNILFIDPAHRMQGLPNVQRYFSNLYENAQSVNFDISSVEHGESFAWVRWTMSFTHPRLNQSQTIFVHGCTHLRFNEQITQHQDYFDLGAMLYENVPVIGRVIRWLKQRLNQ